MRLTKLRHSSHTLFEARRFGADVVHSEWQKWTNDFAERLVEAAHSHSDDCRRLMCRLSFHCRSLLFTDFSLPFLTLH